MKISHAVFAISGFGTFWSSAGESISGISLKVPVVSSSSSTCLDWTAWVPSQTDPAVIMQVVTEGYLPVQKNFIAQLEANSGFSRENIYLVCLDEESEKAVALMGIRCVPLLDQWNNDVHYVWRLRIKVLSCLVEAGHSVILSDSDALWLKDPWQDFNLPEVRGSSIVASRGSFPANLGSLWGSTVCMGFIFFRASAGMNNLLNKVERRVMKTGDDQKAINYALNALGIEWDTSTDMRYILSTDFGRGTIPVGNLDDGGLNVTLLPHDKYTRRCNKVPIGPYTTVAHCFSNKNGSSKISWMRMANLWVGDELE